MPSSTFTLDSMVLKLLLHPSWRLRSDLSVWLLRRSPMMIIKNSGGWKGIRITVKLIIQNRQAKVDIEPNASSLLIKELKEPVRDRKKTKNIKHSGNISKERLFHVARTMRPKSQAKEFKGTVKEILGTAFSIGCSDDGCNPKDLQERIDEGEWEVP